MLRGRVSAQRAIGLALVCPKYHAQAVLEHLSQHSEWAYVIGEITAGLGIVGVHGTLPFGSERP